MWVICGLCGLVWFVYAICVVYVVCVARAVWAQLARRSLLLTWSSPLLLVPCCHRLIRVHILSEERIDCLLYRRDGDQFLHPYQQRE